MLSDRNCRPVVALIQARMGSSRLPGKALLPAAGRSLLAHLVERLRAAQRLDLIAVATTVDPGDDPIIAECERLDLAVFRGSEADVLERFRGAAQTYGAATVVRVTADCPLMDPAEVDRVVSAFLALDGKLDYLANQGPGRRRGPLGLAVEVFSRAALEQAAAEAKERYQREHVTPFMYDPNTPIKYTILDYPLDLSHIRVTVDTPEDLAVVTPVLEALDGQPDGFAMTSALAFLKANPDIAARNSQIAQKSHLQTAPGVALFRADSSVQGDTGHVMRVLGLAQTWIAAGGRATLASIDLPTPLAERFAAVGGSVVRLDGLKTGSTEDLRATAAAARSVNAGVVVVDGYDFLPAWLGELSAEGRPVVYVDDYGLPDLPVAAVVMPNAGALPPPSGQVWAGAPFVPVRAEFQDAPRPERTFDRTPMRLLLTFGGSDPARMSLRGVAAALAVAQDIPLHITVLLGPAHPDVAAVRELAAASGEVEVLHDVREMSTLLARVDVAMAAAGTTCWELATLGVPMLLVPVADNQRIVVDGLLGGDAATALPAAQTLSDGELRAGLRDFLANKQALQAMSAAGRRLIDGQGARRIVAHLARLAGGGR